MTRTDNHNLFKNPPLLKPEHIRMEFSDRTRLRMAIHQFSIRYDRKPTEKEQAYCWRLAKTMAARGFGDAEEIWVEVDRCLFEPINRPKRKPSLDDCA